VSGHVQNNMQHFFDKLLHRFGYVHLEENDDAFIQKLEEVRAELHSRMGVEMCPEIHASCIDCRTRYLIGLINEWIDLLKDEESKTANEYVDWGAGGGGKGGAGGKSIYGQNGEDGESGQKGVMIRK
jgi:hypothetical protein